MGHGYTQDSGRNIVALENGPEEDVNVSLFSCALSQASNLIACM